MNVLETEFVAEFLSFRAISEGKLEAAKDITGHILDRLECHSSKWVLEHILFELIDFWESHDLLFVYVSADHSRLVHECSLWECIKSGMTA